MRFRVFNRGWLVLAGTIGVLLLAACSSGSASSAAAGPASQTAAATASSAGMADTIVIKNFMFSPMSLTVAPGTRITVRNEDSVTHTLTDKASSTVFGTGDIAAGQAKTFNAPNKAGSYSYICEIHQYMTGTIVVR